MSHEITGSDGMFTVRTAAWHGLGTVMTDYPTREEAQEIAHPWEPLSEPMFRKAMSLDDDGKVFEAYQEVPGWVANVRSDNGDTIGVVSDSYTVVTNSELWDIAEAIEGSGTDVMFETGGSLKGGSKVWILLRLQEPLVVKGDPRGETIPYYALQNSHDGSGAFRGQAVTTRIVCANTSRVADMDAKARGTEFVFRHSKNVGDRVEQARSSLAGWRDSLTAWQEQAEYLLTLKSDGLAAGKFIERFIPMPPEHLISERVRNNVIADRAKWFEGYNGITGEGLQNTAYGLVQASIEFAEWGKRAHNAETRFNRSFLTKNAIVTDAVALAIEAIKESV
ncbi:MAG: DUF932 domain-containing protein [Mycetocola sp.]